MRCLNFHVDSRLQNFLSKFSIEIFFQVFLSKSFFRNFLSKFSLKQNNRYYYYFFEQELIADERVACGSYGKKEKKEENI